MNPALINTATLAASFLTLFGSAELLFHYFKVEGEHTRKLVHISTGIICLLFPILLSSHWLVLFLCSSFMAILLLTSKWHLLKSIHQVQRKTRGAFLYPVAVYLAFVLYEYQQNYLYFYLPILIMAISDALAALIGKRYPLRPYRLGKDLKTLSGSLAFFISAFVLSLFFIQLFGTATGWTMIGLAFGLAMGNTLVEGISWDGWDNLFIPLFSMAYLLCFSTIL